MLLKPSKRFVLQEASGKAHNPQGVCVCVCVCPHARARVCVFKFNKCFITFQFLSLSQACLGVVMRFERMLSF